MTTPITEGLQETDHARDKRAQIRSAAARLFADQGYHAASVADLCRDVGLGRGALYYYIESKEALLFDVCASYVVPAAEFVESLAHADLSPTEKIRRLSRMLMRWIADNQDNGTVFLAEHRFLTGEYHERIVEVRDRFETAYASILRQGEETGEFRVTEAVAVKGILGMYNHSYIWLRPDGRLTPEEIGDIFADILLNGVVKES